MDIEKLDEFHKKFESECCFFPNHRYLGHLMDVDINGKNLAVKLGADGKVGFGTGAEALLGIIIAYEMDGFASVQITGGIDEVPTAVALEAGVKALAVNAKGEIVAAEGGKQAVVAKPSDAENLYASIIL